jgi:hypothetical protein
MNEKICKKSQGKAIAFGWGIFKSLLFASAGCIAVFLLRKRAVGSLFALVDSFTLSGFLLSALSVAPWVFGLEGFDSFSYMAKCACWGMFFAAAKGYTEHKKQREELRGKRVLWRGGCFVGGGCFLVGILFLAIFL